MRIWLLRHGEAEPRARTDAQRCLTEAGRNEVRRSAAHLVGRPLQTILASPYVRAQQTAELVREVLGFGGMVETVPWMTPDSDIDEAMLYLSRRSESDLLLVTHQPFVGALGGWLVSGQRSDALPMATASLAELEGEGVAAGLMHLRSLRHPNK
ncbi:phosphohistidine phosphatase SixA [Stutzerimonas nitrititolerans]|uniref:phosphohistidine phosphatase SixA n=1 Tax=Stutzerimonas nitrititolerans TaxID=2482751 RepID=UPI0028AAB060|nr:phosphohistidine phosphatase SixA [Stutzerimonas nitrititolerans]